MEMIVLSAVGVVLLGIVVAFGLVVRSIMRS